ncbi:MAG: hypothetical protein Q8O55_02235 [Dehalococcoidales bacterium]|nr:hypothetical protein [Dehalococcoidales bacterium]
MKYINNNRIKWPVVVFALALIVTSSCNTEDVSSGSPVAVPGASHLGAARLTYEHTVELQAGETVSIEVTLETRKDGPGKFGGRLYRVAREYSEETIPMPGGLEVRLKPSEFTARPNRTYHASIIIETTPELAPGEYILRFEHELEGAFRGSGWITVAVK